MAGPWVDDPALIASYVNAAVIHEGGTISDADLAKAVAITSRESSGDHNRHNPTTATGDDSWGWFQINVLGNLRSRLAELGLTDPQQLTDPWNNARAFAKLYTKSGFNAWGPYKGVSELAGVSPEAITGAQTAVGQARQKGWLSEQAVGTIVSGNGPFEIGQPGGVAGPITGAQDAAGSIIGGIAGIGDLISKVMNTIFSGQFWKWVGLGALGVVLLWAAIIYTNKDEISGAASKVAMGGI